MAMYTKNQMATPPKFVKFICEKDHRWNTDIYDTLQQASDAL